MLFIYFIRLIMLALVFSLFIQLDIIDLITIRGQVLSLIILTAVMILFFLIAYAAIRRSR